MIRRNAGHRGARRVGADQRGSREVHTSEPEIADGAHTEMLMAANPERTLRHPGGCADFGEVKGPIAIRR